MLTTTNPLISFVHIFSLTAHKFSVPPPHKVKRTKYELRPHLTGCARSEGFYKIPMAQKAQYLKSALRQLKSHAIPVKEETQQNQKTSANQVIQLHNNLDKQTITLKDANHVLHHKT